MATPARGPYCPTYDPLKNAVPGEGLDYAPTYWISTAGEPPADDGPVVRDMDADVLIIGSGYTGLCSALFLAREHGIKATVVDANRVAWGCSTRNGGQAQCAAGRLKPASQRRGEPPLAPPTGAHRIIRLREDRCQSST